MPNTLTDRQRSYDLTEKISSIFLSTNSSTELRQQGTRNKLRSGANAAETATRAPGHKRQGLACAGRRPADN